MDIAALVVAVLAMIGAIGSAIYARSQSGAAWTQAADAVRSADAAKESAKHAEDQVALARQQVELSRQSLQAEERARYEARQPYVIVDIRPSDSIRKFYNLVIENIGPSVARDVHIEWDPPIRREESDDALYPIAEARPFTHGIPSLPPGGRITMFFGVSTKLPRLGVDVFTATVTATGPDGTAETHTYEIDLRLRRSMMYHDEYNFHDAVTQLTVIADKIEKLKPRRSD